MWIYIKGGVALIVAHWTDCYYGDTQTNDILCPNLISESVINDATKK